MRKNTKTRRRGAVAVLAAVLMMAMLVMIAFTIDTGYVAHVRTEMQLAADAASLAGVNELAFNSQVNAATLEAADWNNHDDRADILYANDIEVGYWDRDSATFTTPAPQNEEDNSVRVTVRRTQATGNEANLFFMSIFGTSQTDVTATATAMFERSLCGPLVGIDWVWVPGTPMTDSYRSGDGRYNFGRARDNGSLCSNGPINVDGTPVVNGNANAGKGYQTTLTGGAVVTGNKKPRTKPLEMPPVDASGAAASNNNASIPLVPKGNGWKSVVDANGNFLLDGNKSLTLSSGTYYLNDVTLTGQSVLSIDGKVVIYMTGNLDTSGGDIINLSQIPANLQFFMTGGTATIKGDSTFYGAIYAPNTDVTIAGSGDFYGAVVGKTLYVTGNGEVHYDEDLELENQEELDPRVALVE